MKLVVEEIPEKDAIEALFDELSEYPWINSCSISTGGMFGITEKRNFEVDRIFEDVLPRVMVQQFEMKRLDRKKIRDLIRDYEYKTDELKEQLKGLEYTGNDLI